MSEDAVDGKDGKDGKAEKTEKTEKAQMIRDWYRFIGRKGGQVRSERKAAALRKTCERMRKIREEKRRKGEGK